MKIHFYGSRGSIPTPMLLSDFQTKIKKILKLYNKSKEKNIDAFFSKLPFELSHIFGGNTACTTIEEKDKELIVLDAGSGLKTLGNKLAQLNKQTIHIFLSHFHWDHINGIPFFKPLYNPSNTIIFYSTDERMIQNLARQQVESHFPLSFQKLPAKKKFVILDKKSQYKLNDFTIFNIPLNHPGDCTGYIFEKKGKKISYLTDTEFTPDSLAGEEDFYRACFENSTVLILDSQYSVVEIFSKFDWGHTSSNMAVNLAIDWHVKNLVLFHFDPNHKDEDLYKILVDAKNQNKQFNKNKLEIIPAIEGTYLEI
jgi:phosphoribosyl 1,2-cyclic phosphodiesterase